MKKIDRSAKRLYQPGWRKRSLLAHRGAFAQFVRPLKIGLPIGILTILSLVFLWPQLQTAQTPPPKLSLRKILKDNPRLENKVINPKLHAVDKNGNPFLLQAKSALQKDSEETVLDTPRGKVTLQDGQNLFFQAHQGFFMRKTQTLKLVGAVRLKTSKGYDLKTASAAFNLETHQGEGREKIKGTGPAGETIQADGFRILNEGEIITFLGKTSITLGNMF